MAKMYMDYLPIRIRNHDGFSKKIAFIVYMSIKYLFSLFFAMVVVFGNVSCADIRKDADKIGGPRNLFGSLFHQKGYDPTRNIDLNLRYDAAFLASLPPPKRNKDLDCLSEAIYFEARGEAVKGQFAVAEVVLNRVDSDRYPTDVCAVVRQNNGKVCQFSFKCDRRSDELSNKSQAEQVRKIAMLMLEGAPRKLTKGATHFHNTGARPSWRHQFIKTAKIGQHIFYRG